MNSWGTFWQIVVWTAVVSYFGLAVVITIGGIGDVRKMFRRLSDGSGEAP